MYVAEAFPDLREYPLPPLIAKGGEMSLPEKQNSRKKICLHRTGISSPPCLLAPVNYTKTATS